MMKKRYVIALICTVMCLCSACKEEVSDVTIGVMPVADQVVNLASTIPEEPCVKDAVIAEDMDSAVRDFAVRLFQQNLQEKENTLISPVSVLYALGMTANGAVGETLSQMEAVLGTNINNLNPYLCTYRESLPEDERYKLSMANSIWLKDDARLEVKKDFLETNRTWYDADIYQAPFDEGTLKNINSWVNKHTDGMIEEILDEIPEDARLYLVNALAFDGEWKETYEEYQVQDASFMDWDGRKITKEFMYCEENQYLENEDTTGFIKYYKNNKYAFVALLPKEGISISEYVQSLTGEKLDLLLEQAEQIPVDTALPKFETEYDVEMSDVLKAMGMSDAFDSSKADFSNMATAANNLYVGRVLHKTNLQVGEMGTKAGAATAVEILEESAAEAPPEQERKQVCLNRPFLYLLIDCGEKLPIFMGSLIK